MSASKEHFSNLCGHRTFYSQSTSRDQWSIEHILENAPVRDTLHQNPQCQPCSQSLLTLLSSSLHTHLGVLFYQALVSHRAVTYKEGMSSCPLSPLAQTAVGRWEAGGGEKFGVEEDLLPSILPFAPKFGSHVVRIPTSQQ